MGARKGHAKWGGRVAGTPNKVTVDARAAISKFVDGNAHRLQQWLDQVAAGVTITETDKDGNPRIRVVSPPDPERAFVLFQSVIEYHVPKLARNEQTGAGGGPQEMVVRWADPKS